MRPFLDRRPWLCLTPAGVLAAAGQAIALPVLAATPGAPSRPDLAGALEGKLPEFMFEIQFLELQIWQWLGLVLLVAVAGLLAWLIGGIVRRLLQPLVDSTETLLDDQILAAVYPPGRALLAIGLFAVGSVVLSLTEASYSALGRIEVTLVVMAATWMLLRLVNALVDDVKEKLEQSDRQAAIAVVPLASRTLKAFLLVIAALALLQNVGFNVTGLIAGLGVGGLAVALAAQKTIANLFGGVSIIADQPVRVGDFCRFGGNQTGTIEDIGIRSTRVRTLDRTIVTVPNSDFSEFQLENFAMRDRIRLTAMIGLRYETSPDQLRHVLAELRKLLIAHPKVADSPRRVRFVGFGPHSLDLELFTYIDTNDWDAFMAIREDIFLRIMDVVAESGTGFAFPSQTLYLGRDTGLDVDGKLRAEKEVATWRDGNKLPFPDFAPGTVDGIATLDYPPPGSEIAP